MWTRRARHCVRCAVLAATAVVCAYALDLRLLLSQYQKRHWRVEDGLPHNYVMSVLPDRDGYLLVGTDEGLARFDGVRFVPYDLHPSLGLSKRWVLSMIAAHDGSLWAGTFDGGLYQTRAGQLITRVEKGASVFAILEDAEGHISASTRSGVIRGTSGGRFDYVPELERPPDLVWSKTRSHWKHEVSLGWFRRRDGDVTR